MEDLIMFQQSQSDTKSERFLFACVTLAVVVVAYVLVLAVSCAAGLRRLIKP